MSWREQLRPASFRGVPFLVDDSQQQLGRRTAVTEYPGRDEPSVEDLGRRAWSDSLSAFVIGDDHLDQAQRLADALNAFGPGELVHPYLGTRLVQVGEVSLRHSNREGGLSTFTIEVKEAGPVQSPGLAINTDSALQQSCDAAEDSMLDDFVSIFAIDSLPQRLVDELAAAFEQCLEIIAPGQDLWARGQNLWAQAQGALGQAGEWVATGQTWKDQVESIGAGFSDPLSFGGGLFYGLRDLFGVFGKTGNSGPYQAPGDSTPAPAPASPPPASTNDPSPEQLLEVLRALPATAETRITPVNLTDTRVEQGRLQGDLLDLVQGATVIAGAQASSLIEYRDRQQADQVREAFLEAIERCQDTASDSVYASLQQVRVDLIADLGARGAGLPSVTRLVPQRTLPALVQAYHLYGDSRRESELVARNQIEHPGFVPALETLEVVR
ncbi:DNA circularization N-terminal domain-containing protein [Pseudomonas resinovorans]|uniref:DNA circularization N-terminal domain-containing protein n=1 Tax=Metapseudomonas resinovorans TaxID=53412 RepID=A0ABT4Y416_METRE|nr:DNA circularization N-terminal domain-containing protein [Pseudomonas resinovorans]MDA8483588.1 DNA circularization N-terminal domain-containing protein [Pseudomonas resinovorans]